jgi:hypothetical protein
MAARIERKLLGHECPPTMADGHVENLLSGQPLLVRLDEGRGEPVAMI